MTSDGKEVRSCDHCKFAEDTNSETYPKKCLVSKPGPMLVHKFCINWMHYAGCCVWQKK